MFIYRNWFSLMSALGAWTILLTSFPVQAQFLQIPPALEDAYSRASAIYELAEDLDRLITEAENNTQPVIDASRFRNMEQRAAEIEKVIRLAKLAGVRRREIRDKAQKALEAYTYCETTEAALKEVETIVNLLVAAEAAADGHVKNIDAAIAANRKASDFLNHAIKKTALLTTDPFLAELIWLWRELDKIVKAFDGIHMALLERQKELQFARGDINGERRSAAYFFKLQREDDCRIPESLWDGHWRQADGRTGKIVLELKRSKGRYDCTMHFPEASPPLTATCISFRVWPQERRVIFTRLGRQGNSATLVKYELNLSSDFRRMSGTQWVEPPLSADIKLDVDLRKR